jgi:molybdopterin molybdotransferase
MTVEDARRDVLSRISRSAPEPVDLLNALGRVIAADVAADVDVAVDDAWGNPWEIRAGDTVLRSGWVLDAASLGLIAAAGHVRVRVFRRPDVAILSTGDELVGVADVPGPGKVRNSNAYALAARVRAAGGVPRLLGIAHDESAEMRTLLRLAPMFDLMVTTGGVSLGDFDLVRDVLAEVGELESGALHPRLRASQTYGVIRGTPFFGLPGKPASTMVGFELFVRPAIRKMQGFAALDRPRVCAVLGQDVRKKSGRHYYTRGVLSRVEGGEGGCKWEATVSGRRAFGRLAAGQGADCLVSLPDGDADLKAGTVVDCLRLDKEEGTP